MAADWLQPIYEQIRTGVMAGGYAQVDETPVAYMDCIHIGDRESDILELFCLAEELKTKFLLRTCVDRLAQDGKATTAEHMKNADVRGTHAIEVRDDKGKISKAVLEIKFEKMVLKPPIGKQNQYPDLVLTVIHVTEKTAPKGRKRFEWKLVTNLPVEKLEDVSQMLEWYSLRWKIETFHKILKSGCRAEESKLRSAEGLAKLLWVFCIVSWRVFWMTMIKRAVPKASPEVAITSVEKEILDKLFGKPGNGSATLEEYLLRIAKLGGYLARTHDAPAGNLVMWRGVLRLTDIQLGFLLARDVGN